MCQRFDVMEREWKNLESKGVFSSENFWLLATVAFSFVFDKNCPIMDYLDLKDSSRRLRATVQLVILFTYI